jgi:hypothetical protein
MGPASASSFNCRRRGKHEEEQSGGVTEPEYDYGTEGRGTCSTEFDALNLCVAQRQSSKHEGCLVQNISHFTVSECRHSELRLLMETVVVNTIVLVCNKNCLQLKPR